jgi:uncharacterized tellurite resistance protein B-like protein
MKKIRDLFIKKDYLLEEPEVEQLLDYCEQLEDQIIDYKFEKTYNKELILLDMVREILKGCTDIQKKQEEHERFGYEAPDYEQRIADLKQYIMERCRDEKIKL